MKSIKSPAVLLMALVLVMTFSVISYAVTDKINPPGKDMKDKANFSKKQKPVNVPNGSDKPDSNGNSVAPDSTTQNNTAQNQAPNNVANIPDAQILIEITDIKKQTAVIITSDNNNMRKINIQKSQVDNYIDYIKKGSIVYSDDQLSQINTLLSTLTSDSQTVRSDTSIINSDIDMVNTFLNNKNNKNALTKLNDELSELNTRSADINKVASDFTSALSVLLQGQAVKSIINQPTASPANSALVPSNSSNTTN
ncbi:hypothetical protein [Clostridium akagii]|uniref:hypothetical protein n=1 Tax=Clostridium akagii TaxID=91623 RepID=UPI00047DEA4E|nr:hypothetical protein [Clostridium akagii]